MSDPERALERAAAEYDRVRGEVEAVGGQDALRRTTGAYRNFLRLLAGHEDSATGSGFQEYLAFQDAVADHVEQLDEGLPGYEAFEAADDALHKRRLSASDFEEARELLDPVREHADLLIEWEAAGDLLRSARADARRRVAELDERIDHLERLLELGEADLDAPVERLRDPIEAYDAAVLDAFETFERESSAREVFSVVESADAYPLVDVRQPPTRLAEYVREDPAGEESIPTLLEYADYSAEKLSHYVDDPGDLKRHVATNRTYLMELDASPLTVAYPPPGARTLRYECKEYAAVCNRFAPSDVLAKLRAVRTLPEETDYERLRTAARALEEMTESERAELDSGDVDAELRAVRAKRERLRERLAATPEP